MFLRADNSRRIKVARFPAVKSLDTFDFLAIPSLNSQLVTQLARCEYIESRENVIAIGNSGTGKTRIDSVLGLAACQMGLTVGFTDNRYCGSVDLAGLMLDLGCD